VLQEYYVAPSGSDDWSGTEPEPTADGDDGPFETLDAAQSAVRSTLEEGPGDVTVYVRDGTYYRSEPLTFSTADSGTGGHDVVWRNYPGERPRIVGGRPLTEWEAVEGREDIYRTDVDEDWTFNALFEDGQRSRVARHPADGYSRVTAPDEDDPRAAFAFESGDVPVLEDPSGLQLYIWPGGPDGEWNWHTKIVDVDEVDYEDQTVRAGGLDSYVLGPGTRYFVLNHLELLDEPGEFYRSPDGEVYYYPRGDISDATVVAPTGTAVFAIEGETPSEPVRNLRFEGLDVEVSDRPRQTHIGHLDESPGSIRLSNAEGITVARCRIRNSAASGVVVEGHAQNVTIESNEVHDIGQHGVQLSGPTSRDYLNRGNVVSNNHVHHVGQVSGDGHGISLAHSGNNVVSNNRVHHSSRFSIVVASMPRPTTMTGYGHTVEEPQTIDGIEVSPENVRIFQHARNNVVEYNDLSHANLDSQDTGVVYTNTGGRGNVIHGNRLHDSEIPFSFGFGLYLDDTSDGVTASNNLIHDLNHDGDGTLQYGIYAKGLDDILINNVVADNEAAVGGIGSHEHGGTWNHGLVIERNVLSDTGPNVYGFSNWSTERVAKADHNVVYNADDEYGISDFPDNYALYGESYDVETFDDWRSFWDQRFDQESEVGDPKFMDPDNDDYRFRYDSPVYDHGIESIDHASPGLRADFPFTDPEPMDRAFVHIAGEDGTPAFVELDEGETVDLTISARTETGYRMDPTDLTVTYESDDESVATVDDGTVTARTTGVTEVIARVESDDIVREVPLHALVS